MGITLTVPAECIEPLKLGALTSMLEDAKGILKEDETDPWLFDRESWEAGMDQGSGPTSERLDAEESARLSAALVKEVIGNAHFSVTDQQEIFLEGPLSYLTRAIDAGRMVALERERTGRGADGLDWFETTRKELEEMQAETTEG